MIRYDGSLISLKRTYVFLSLGPILAVLGAVLADVAAGRGFPREIGEGAFIAFVFGLAVSVVTGPVDGYLAHVLPLPLRVPLTAIVGATIATGLILYLIGKAMPLHFPTPIAIIGALSMGVCSLLSHDYADSGEIRLTSADRRKY
jgi:hypothetical protein